MNWKLLGIVAAVAGIGSIIASSAEGSTTEKRRKVIRSYFKVSGDCNITFDGEANAFWQRFDPYLTEMIALAATLKITDPEGVASYVMLALFPECDQTKEQTLSFRAVYAALEFRLEALMG
jgi:hypothetical protein